MEFVSKSYVKFRPGSGNPYVLVDALHAVGRRAEVFTDELAAKVSEETDCHCIIATVPREKADLNRYPNRSNCSAVEEYRHTIRGILGSSGLLRADGKLRAPFLHLSLHGMLDRYPRDIELGTVFGESCSEELLKWLVRCFRNWASSLERADKTPVIETNTHWYGEPVIAVHRMGDEAWGYQGYGERFNTVQIELAHWLRTGFQKELIELLSGVAVDFGSYASRNSPAP